HRLSSCVVLRHRSCSCFFFSRCRDPRDLHSFPTRRSSDLPLRAGADPRELDRPAFRALLRERLRVPAMVAAQLLVAMENERDVRSEEHTSELQSRRDLVCRLLLEKKKKKKKNVTDTHHYVR